MSTGDTVTSVVRATETVSSKAPHWIALLLVILSFLIYMDRAQDTNNRLADHRIATCHAVQNSTNIVLSELSKTLTEASTENALMRAEIQTFRATIERHTLAVEHLIYQMEVTK